MGRVSGAVMWVLYRRALAGQPASFLPSATDMAALLTYPVDGICYTALFNGPQPCRSPIMFLLNHHISQYLISTGKGYLEYIFFLAQ